MRKTGVAFKVPFGHSWGTSVYRRGGVHCTGPDWHPLGTATGANEPHKHLGLVI